MHSIQKNKKQQYYFLNDQFLKCTAIFVCSKTIITCYFTMRNNTVEANMVFVCVCGCFVVVVFICLIISQGKKSYELSLNE